MKAAYFLTLAIAFSMPRAWAAEQTPTGTQTYKSSAPLKKNVQGTEPHHLADFMQRGPMTFFIASPMGDGGNLGGLEGADRHCQNEAAAHGPGEYAKGAEKRVWRAYLSTQGANAEDARDRIGAGPWHNYYGALIARDLSHLHGDTLDEARDGNLINVRNAVDARGEKMPHGEAIPKGAGENHDVLTGTKLDGRRYESDVDRTCGNWTSNANLHMSRSTGRIAGSARVGHWDRSGITSNSWNSSHDTEGCSLEALWATSGEGRFMCFAVEGR